MSQDYSVFEDRLPKSGNRFLWSSIQFFIASISKMKKWFYKRSKPHLSVGYYPTVDYYRTESSKVKRRGRYLFSATKIIKIDEIVKNIHNFEVRGFPTDFQGSSSVNPSQTEVAKMSRFLTRFWVQIPKIWFASNFLFIEYFQFVFCAKRHFRWTALQK